MYHLSTYLGIVYLRSDSIIGQELVFVKKSLENTYKSFFACKSQESPVTLTDDCMCIMSPILKKCRVVLTFHVSHIPLRHLRSILDEPIHSLFEPRKSIYCRWFQSESCIKRYQTDETFDLHLHRMAWVEGDCIIVKAILLVPQRDVLIVRPLVCHCVRDEYKMLEKLGCNVFVHFIMFRQLQRHVKPDNLKGAV